MGFFRKTGSLGTGKTSASALRNPGRSYWAGKRVVWEMNGTVHRMMVHIPIEYIIALCKHFYEGKWSEPTRSTFSLARDVRAPSTILIPA